MRAIWCALVCVGSLTYSTSAHAADKHDVFYQVGMSPAFTPEEQGFIGDALEHWIIGSKLSSRPIHFQVRVVECNRSQNDYLICLHKGTTEGMPSSDVGWTNWLPDSHSADIWVKTEVVFSQYRSEVWQHELGHALGLSHTGEGTLMCWTTRYAALNVTLADIQQWEQLAP